MAKSSTPIRRRRNKNIPIPNHLIDNGRPKIMRVHRSMSPIKKYYIDDTNEEDNIINDITKNMSKLVDKISEINENILLIRESKLLNEIDNIINDIKKLKNMVKKSEILRNRHNTPPPIKRSLYTPPKAPKKY